MQGNLQSLYSPPVDEWRQAQGGRRLEEGADATRRTRLANERTYLAWWRTGLTAFAVSLGVGKIVPVLSDSSEWPYQLLGAGFAVMGVLCVGYGYHRERAVDRAIRRGDFAPPDARATFGLTAFAVVLGLMTVLLIASGR
jgi:putative membrane protein